VKRLCLTLILAASPVWAVEVPSGQPIELHEVLVDDMGTETWLRFRFLAPQIARTGGSIDYGKAEPDMAHLCDALALPYIAEYDLKGEVIVISLADREVEFGAADPDATQFFEAYRIQNNACIWEGL